MTEPMTLPDMTIPFPGVCHPEIDRIESEAMAWVSRYAADEAMRELEKTRAGRIVARTAGPDAPGELLRAYGKMLAWGFWFDDRFIDDTRADSPESVPAIRWSSWTRCPRSAIWSGSGWATRRLCSLPP